MVTMLSATLALAAVLVLACSPRMFLAALLALASGVALAGPCSARAADELRDCTLLREDGIMKIWGCPGQREPERAYVYDEDGVTAFTDRRREGPEPERVEPLGVPIEDWATIADPAPWPHVWRDDGLAPEPCPYGACWRRHRGRR